MTNRRLLIAILSVTVLFGITACSSTTLHQTWKDPQESSKASNILILATAKNQASRQLFEAELAKQLSAREVKAIPSFTVIPQDEIISKELIIRTAQKNQVDSVIVLTVLDTRQEKQTVTTIQSDAGRYRSGYYNRDRDWYNNYSGGYTTVHSYQNDYTIANVETSLYRLDGERMIWTALSETITLNAGVQDIRMLATEIAKQLKKDGMI